MMSSHPFVWFWVALREARTGNGSATSIVSSSRWGRVLSSKVGLFRGLHKLAAKLCHRTKALRSRREVISLLSRPYPTNNALKHQFRPFQWRSLRQSRDLRALWSGSHTFTTVLMPWCNCNSENHKKKRRKERKRETTLLRSLLTFSSVADAREPNTSQWSGTTLWLRNHNHLIPGIIPLVLSL